MRSRTGPLSIDDFLADYPELADQARERLESLTGPSGSITPTVRIGSLDTVAPGVTIGDFVLLTELEPSDLGPVFLARQLSMQRLVAIRITTEVGRQRQMTQLDHPHIVRVFDHHALLVDPGDEKTETAAQLVYMQYLPGGTARGLLALRRGGSTSDGGNLLLRAIDTAMEARGEIRPADSVIRREVAQLSWPETVAWIGRRLAGALRYAERKDVLHQSIRPDKVLFTAEGVPKLADFAVDGSELSPATNSAVAIADWAAYRSPEQLALALDPTSPAPDGRSDIYSLGVLLWEMLTGSRPFDDRTDAGNVQALEEVLRNRRQGPSPAAVARIPLDCPAALRRVLLTCLEPDPAHRWPNGDVLASQLDLCLDSHARDLVDPLPRSWRVRLRPWRLVLITLAILIPNVLAALYNIEHDTNLIRDNLSDETRHRFEIATAVVNSVGFSVAAALLAYFGRHGIFTIRRLQKGETLSPATLRSARASALLFGDRAVVVILSLWILSGMAFPIIMYGSPDSVSPDDYVHYVISHVICGAIAVIYPFFLVNFYLVRCLYPMLTNHGQASEEDARRLHRLRLRCARYLVVAASIPLVAVASATLLAPPDLAQIIVVLRILCIGSIAAFVAVYRLFMSLEDDLHALERVLKPAPG
ncbi:serine/threonine protein kinase [Nocardia lijiangensis]|uniref:serine/threonine protein kinase n=1 Tax=Nocardia lijiangensis TaxID=299618 RepID=UPI003D738FD2